MGSCFSRRNASGPPPTTVRRSPEAPPVEETVKEVLSSETPAARPSICRLDAQKPPDAPLLIDDTCSSSEICSSLVSESLSTSTATTKATEKKGAAAGGGWREGGTRTKDAPPSPSPVRNRRKRSVSGELHAIKMRDASVGIGCRSSTSPAKNKREAAAVGRTYSAREAGPRSRAAPPLPQPSLVGPRREPQPAGERSGLRSVSPAVKLQAAGDQRRSLSAPRMNGRASPRRAPPPPPLAGMRYEEGGGRRQVLDAVGEGGGGGGDEGEESLENPLVSLECFIFL